MRKTKTILAVALTAVMVIGSSTAVFADPVTNGGTDGTGTSEGHLEKKVVSVELPTVPDTGSPFDYTMDPERLIQETSAGKYAEGSVFPAAEGDTGVYFLTGDKTYTNESSVLKAINKSSCAIKLTVKVKATTAGTDIALAESSTVSTDTTPNLYLGLKVGEDTKVVKAEEQTVEKVIPGVPTNFETAVVDGAYVYREKASATTWKAMNISLEGAVSKLPIAPTTTAPVVNVTWEYAEATAGAEEATDVAEYTVTPPAPAVPPITGATAVEGQAYNYTTTFTKGTALQLSATGLTAVLWANEVGGTYAASTNISVANGTATIAGNMWASATAGNERYLQVTIGGVEYKIKVTIATA